MDNNKYTTYNNEEQMFPSPFVTELDEKSVKELNLVDRMEFYNQCLTNSKYLENYTKEKKLSLIENIGDIMHLINECSKPIYERRERVSKFFNSIKDFLLKERYLLPNGKIINIGYNIPDEIFLDIYHIFADALCCRFQLNQFDGKYRDGLFHCIQYLNYRYYFNNYDQQYPDATKEKIEILNRTNFLDIVTGRQNAYFEVQGVQYKCSAYLDDGVFRLKIAELVPWNISNASKMDLTLDLKEKSIWSVDDRYKVKLDATQMACYTFIYNNPDTDIDTIFANKDKFIACINDCDSGSRKFEDYLNKGDKTAFEKGLKKRISEINQKVHPILGMAYTIFNKKVNEKESYYIPISKNIKEEPDDI